MATTPSTTWRQRVAVLFAVAVIARGLWLVFINLSIGSAPGGSSPPSWFTDRSDQLQPVKEQLSSDQIYKLRFPPQITESDGYMFTRGITEYILAPIVVDDEALTGDTFVDYVDEASLEKWIAQKRAKTIIRFGQGMALVREEQP